MVEDYGRRRIRYYELGAGEYDAGWGGAWIPDGAARTAFEEEIRALGATLSALPAAGRTLDVACGTGQLTRHLAGEIVGLDASPRMLALARKRVPNATFVLGDAFALPFPDASFARVFAGNFYGLLLPDERPRFLREMGRVAPEMVVAEVAEQDVESLGWRKRESGWQERTLTGGSEHLLYRRYFSAEDLARELSGEVLFDGAYLVAARVGW